MAAKTILDAWAKRRDITLTEVRAGRTTTFVTGLSSGGMIALFVPDRPVSRHASEMHVERVLVPERKALRRKSQARTIEILWQTVGSLVGTCSPTECQRYFDAGGYPLDALRGASA